MPFIPHTPHDVATMLEAIGVAPSKTSSTRFPKELRAGELKHVPPGAARWTCSRCSPSAPNATASTVFPRRRQLRPPHSGRRLGRRAARRVPHRVHAVSGRSEPGHAAAHLRIPEHDDLADRHGRVERVGLRRRLRPRRSGADGGARQQEEQVAPRGEPDTVNPRYRDATRAIVRNQRIDDRACR